MKSPRYVAAFTLAFGLLVGLAFWLSYRRNDSAAPRSFAASEKVKAKLQAMRQQLAARLKQTNPSAQRESAKPFNALAATAALASSKAPTYDVAANPALESEAEDLGGIEIPKGEDGRAQTIRMASRAAQDEARQRFERIKKLYPFIPNTAFDKRELVKKELRETNPDIRQIDDWRAVLARRAGGVTTRCNVERQRSFVQRAMASPRLMINDSDGTGTAVHRPPVGEGTSTSSPPGASSAHSTVTVP